QNAPRMHFLDFVDIGGVDKQLHRSFLLVGPLLLTYHISGGPRPSSGCETAGRTRPPPGSHPPASRPPWRSRAARAQHSRPRPPPARTGPAASASPGQDPFRHGPARFEADPARRSNQIAPGLPAPRPPKSGAAGRRDGFRRPDGRPCSARTAARPRRPAGTRPDAVQTPPGPPHRGTPRRYPPARARLAKGPPVRRSRKNPLARHGAAAPRAIARRPPARTRRRLRRTCPANERASRTRANGCRWATRRRPRRRPRGETWSRTPRPLRLRRRPGPAR